jgi:hypothetical protein
MVERHNFSPVKPFTGTDVEVTWIISRRLRAKDEDYGVGKKEQ